MIRCALIFIIAVSCNAQEFISFLPSTVFTGNHLSVSNIAFWRMDDHTGNATDSSGNGRTLTQNGTVADGGGLAIVNSARTFSASDDTDYFSRASEAAFTFGTNAFTLTCWAYFDSGGGTISGDMTLIAKTDLDTPAVSWWLELDHASPNDLMSFYYSSDGTLGAHVDFTFSGNIPADTWYFVYVRYDSVNIHVCATPISSANLATDATGAFAGPFFDNSTTPLTVGAVVEGTVIHDFGGNMDEIGIWNRYLSDCELGKLFTAKAGTFSQPSFDSNACVP